MATAFASALIGGVVDLTVTSIADYTVLTDEPFVLYSELINKGGTRSAVFLKITQRSISPIVPCEHDAHIQQVFHLHVALVLSRLAFVSNLGKVRLALCREPAFKDTGRCRELRRFSAEAGVGRSILWHPKQAAPRLRSQERERVTLHQV
jgi:hypothetical protein